MCNENKGPDQLCGYRTADLQLCFSHIQKASFLMTGLINECSCITKGVRDKSCRMTAKLDCK